MNPEFAVEAFPIMWKVLCGVFGVLITVLIAIGKRISNDIRGLNVSIQSLAVEFREELNIVKSELHDRITKSELQLMQIQTTCQMEHGHKFGRRATDTADFGRE